MATNPAAPTSFIDYVGLALTLMSSINTSVDAVAAAVTDTGLHSPETFAAVKDARDSLNHHGFHFDQWDVLAQLLNVSL